MSTGGDRYLPCLECGAPVPVSELRAHVCNRERWLEYQVLSRREELRRFDEELGEYLATPKGRFELWYAARDRGGDLAA
jgi:hypothetical protein